MWVRFDCGLRRMFVRGGAETRRQMTGDKKRRAVRRVDISTTWPKGGVGVHSVLLYGLPGLSAAHDRAAAALLPCCWGDILGRSRVGKLAWAGRGTPTNRLLKIRSPWM